MEGMWEEFNRPLVSMVTKLLLSKLKNALMTHIGLMEHGEIFAAFFSAVYGPMGKKLGGKVEEGCKNGLRPLVSMVTTFLPCKSENALTAHILA